VAVEQHRKQWCRGRAVRLLPYHSHTNISNSPPTYLTMEPLDLVPENPLDREEHAKKDEEVMKMLSALFASTSVDSYWVFVVVAERVRWPTMTDDTDFIRQVYLEHRVALDAIAAEALETRSFERIRRLGARRFLAGVLGLRVTLRYSASTTFSGSSEIVVPTDGVGYCERAKSVRPTVYERLAPNAAFTDKSAGHIVWRTIITNRFVQIPRKPGGRSIGATGINSCVKRSGK
jgi:hypothetical protein